jgi:Gam-like protein
MRQVTQAVLDNEHEGEAGNSPEDAIGAADVELERLVPQRFGVRDRDSANWVAKRVLEAERDVEDAKAWLQRLVRRAERQREFFLRRFGAEMEAWARSELVKLKGRCKSIDLPSGRVGFRMLGEKLVVDDEEAALTWAKRYCRPAVVTVQKLSKSALNEHVKRTGEVPNGTSVQQKKEVFYIR